MESNVADLQRLNAQLVSDDVCMLREQLDQLKAEMDLKEKLLEETMTAEKTTLDRELSRMKANNAALAMEVQEGRQQLETTIADTALLSDEVLSKTQQLKQYKKQLESYKNKLEEMTTRLHIYEEQIKRMEEDHRHHVCSIQGLSVQRVCCRQIIIPTMCKAMYYKNKT